MSRIANVAIFVVALIHVLIMTGEIFPLAPNSPQFLVMMGPELGFAEGQAVHASPIVRNAGLFNGFIAAGLFWCLRTSPFAFQIRVFFLSCVMIAGIFGACTLPWPLVGQVHVPVTLIGQTIPGAVAIAFSCLANKHDVNNPTPAVHM